MSRAQLDAPSSGTVITQRLWLFGRSRRFGPGAAKKLARKMRGQTGAICSIRNPPLLDRSVSVRHTEWGVTRVEFAHLPARHVPVGTMAPFGVLLGPGVYHIALCGPGGRLVKSTAFEVVRDHVTVVTVFPPTLFMFGSKNVRRMSTIEVQILPEH